MGFLYEAQQFLTTPSQKRTYFFIGTGIAFLIIIIIIIVAASSSSSDEKSTPTPSTPWEMYLEAKKYLYVWWYPNTTNFIQFVKDHKFSRVYLYIGTIQNNYDALIAEDFSDSGDTDAKIVMQKLIDMGVEVEPTIYLHNNPNNFDGVTKLEEVAKVLANLQKTIKFKALHFDVEPNHLNKFENLLNMYETVRPYLKVSAILKPAWLYQKMSALESKFTSADYFKKFKDCETFADALMMVSDYSDLMAYSNTYEKINEYLDLYEVVRKRHTNHESKPIIELNPDITDDGIYVKYEEDRDTFFKWVYDVSKRFDGINIHFYQVWAKDLYCEELEYNTPYYFGEPKDC